MTDHKALVERLTENAEMLCDGYQKNLTKLWHSETVKHAAADAKEAAAAITSLVEERDTWSRAEKDLSNAYLRLRSILPGAYDTPHAPSAEHVWQTTEDAARRLRARALAAEAETVRLREALEKIAKDDGKRHTVNPENAFMHFNRLNRELIDVRDMARAALAKPEGV